MRNDAKTRVRGRVVIHGPRYSSGEIVELSMTEMRVRMVERAATLAKGDRVALDVRFDGAGGAWSGITGHVQNANFPEVVIAFETLPEEFEDRIQSQLLAMLESEHVVH